MPRPDSVCPIAVYLFHSFIPKSPGGIRSGSIGGCGPFRLFCASPRASYIHDSHRGIINSQIIFIWNESSSPMTFLHAQNLRDGAPRPGQLHGRYEVLRGLDCNLRSRVGDSHPGSRAVPGAETGT